MMSQRDRRERATSEREKTPAPALAIQDHEVFAVEHPMIIHNIDKALKTFGTNRPFRRILDSGDPEECLPLYLRPHDPMSVPILSHNGATTNVLLKITVPKRTGRKRKRGTQDPWFNPNEKTAGVRDAPVTLETSPPAKKILVPYHGESIMPPDEASISQNIASQSRRDDPAILRRMMKDNIGKYTFEPVAKIKRTHRYRSMSDFQQSTNHGDFMPTLKDTMLTGNVSKMRNFQLDTSMGVKSQGEIMPPPSFSQHAIPFNWAWQQNPNIFIENDPLTNEPKMVNHSANFLHTAGYLPRDTKIVPTHGPLTPPTERGLLNLIAALKAAFAERPLWTRRSLINKIGHFPSFYLLRNAIPYVGYMFKGGPFRDSIIRYGIDPRNDPKYRKYQVFFFKLFTKDSTAQKGSGDPWEESRHTQATRLEAGQPSKDTHLFDGKNLTLDGKIWQVCDITDPLLVSLIESAPYPEKCDTAADGWFTNGRLAKIKAIMKVKIIAIRTGKKVTEADFKDALAVEDIQPLKTFRTINVPIPELRLSEVEIAELEAKGVDLKRMGLAALKCKPKNSFAKSARAMGKAGETRGKYKRVKKTDKGTVDERLGLEGPEDVEPKKGRGRGSKPGQKRGPYRDKKSVDAMLNKAEKERKRERFLNEQKRLAAIEGRENGTEGHGEDIISPLSSPDDDEDENGNDDNGGGDGQENAREEEEEEGDNSSSEESESSDDEEGETSTRPMGAEAEEDEDKDDDSEATEEADFTQVPRAAFVPM